MVRAMGAQRTRKKGSLWDLYSHIIEGRILLKPDGTKGVVCCFKYHDYSMKFAAVYLVRWEKTKTTVDVPANLVERWVTDTFANETWVPKKIRAAQLANWHEDKVGNFMDSPLLKVQGKHHSESEAQPPNKKAKLGANSVQSIFISPPKPGETRDMAEALQQATKANMLRMDQVAASRRNCRSVHMSPEGSPGGEEQEQEGEREGEGQGLVGHLRAGLGRLFGSGSDAGTSPEKGTAKVNGSAPLQGTSAASPAAEAAVHMGAATALVAKGQEQRAEAGPSSKKAKGAASPAGGKANGKSSGSKGGRGKAGAEEENEEEEEWVPSWTGRMYPRSLCYRPGDKLVKDLTMDDLSGDFEVERIIDEFCSSSKKAKWFLIKYKGYELRIGNGVNEKGDWETLKNVKGTDAYIEWQKRKPAYFFQAIPKAEKKA